MTRVLTIVVPGGEAFNEAESQFITVKGRELQLEHSLVSISKWESKWKKSFIATTNKTDAEIKDYVRCMTISQNVDPNIYKMLTRKNIEVINKYINDPMTATTFKKKNGSAASQIITSEIIYYWMISLEIPMECQKWHLNRLLTLIRVCDEKNQPGKKMSTKDIMRQNRSLNAARKARHGTRG